MARGKKKEELSLEEKLEQALVPVEEWPYEVPGNWCFFRFTGLIDIEGGTQPPKSQFVDEPLEGYVRLVQIRDFASDKYVVYVPDTKKLRKFDRDDVMIARYGASIGRICIGLEGAYNVALAKTIFSRKILNRDYVYWMLQSETFQNPLRTISRSAQAGFNKEDLLNFVMPLPPLKEQQRIVERIESLFVKLDEAKEKVSDVVKSSEIRQLALINHLFTGELAGIKEAYTIPLFDIVEEIKIGPFGSSLHKEDYIMDGTPVINPKHISKQGINPDQKVSITSEKARELSSYVLKENDIIMGRRGEMGRTAPISQKEEGYICGTGSLIIRLKKEFRADLYSQILGSQCVINHLEQNCVGSTMKNLNEKIVKQIPIPYFTKEQQDKLMFRFETMLSEEQQVLDKLGGIVDAISLIKKAILAKAFRGELGTNNSEEQPAIETLKTIFMEK